MSLNDRPGQEPACFKASVHGPNADAIANALEWYARRIRQGALLANGYGGGDSTPDTIEYRNVSASPCSCPREAP